MKSNYFAKLFSKKFFDDTNQQMFKYILINIYEIDRITTLDIDIDIVDFFDLYIMIDKYDLKILFSYVNFENEIIKRLNSDNLQMVINYINIVYETNILNQINQQNIILKILKNNEDKNLVLDFGDLHGMK